MPTHKTRSLAAHPCKCRFAAKHLFFPHTQISVIGQIITDDKSLFCKRITELKMRLTG